MTTLNDIVDIFDLLGDWDQRYQYLIELGEKLPAMPSELQTDANKVKGCMSQVWVAPYHDQEDGRRYHFHAECDTSIIKGVLAVLLQLTDNKTAREIEQLDVDEMFERLQLDEHLSPNRHVGVYAIVELMKQQVREAEKKARQVA